MTDPIGLRFLLARFCESKNLEPYVIVLDKIRNDRQVFVRVSIKDQSALLMELEDFLRAETGEDIEIYLPEQPDESPVRRQRKMAAGSEL